MLLVFHSKAAADVLMLSHHAAPLLRAANKILDQHIPTRGVFSTAQLPDAIAAIAQVSAQDDMATQTDAVDDPVPAMEQTVSLKTRAWPLLDMLRRAQAKGVDVLWEQA